MAFSPDGAHAASCSSDNSIALWSTGNWREEKRLQNPAMVDDVTFSPDGAKLAWIITTTRDIMQNQLPNNGLLTIWDIPADTRITREAGEGSFFRSLAYSPDGKWLVLQRDNRCSQKDAKYPDIILWNTREEKIEKTLTSPPPNSIISSPIFTADSAHLLAGTMDGLVQCNIATGEVKPIALNGIVTMLTPLRARQNSLLLTGDRSGITQIWDFHAALAEQKAQPRATLYTFTKGCWLISTPDGYFDCSPEMTKAIGWRQGGQVYPYKQFEKQYHWPDLVQKVLAE